MNADKMFDGFIALAKIIVDQRTIERKRKKDAASMRRKVIYAARKAAETLPKRVRPEPLTEPVYEPRTSCYCQHTNPPCSWCVDGPEDAE